MNALTAALKEELNVEMISLGGLQVPESVVVSWGIMLFLVIVSILLTRNLKVDHISRRQAILELVVTTIDNFFTGLLGEQGRRYVPYLMTVALYIACANLIGVFGIKPPTKDLDVTAALALSTLLNVLYFLYTTLLLWVPEAGEKRDRRLKWAAVPGLVFAALNIAVGLRSYGLMDLFRQGMDLFCQ